jgi:hypothetical protein
MLLKHNVPLIDSNATSFVRLNIILFSFQLTEAYQRNLTDRIDGILRLFTVDGAAM